TAGAEGFPGWSLRATSRTLVRPRVRYAAAMHGSRSRAATLLAAMAALLAGRATTRHEAPPEVAPQPPEVTTAEVMDQHAADVAAEDVQQAARDEDATRRYRPTTRSVDEIQSSRAEVPPPLDFRQR